MSMMLNLQISAGNVNKDRKREEYQDEPKKIYR